MHKILSHKAFTLLYLFTWAMVIFHGSFLFKVLGVIFFAAPFLLIADGMKKKERQARKIWYLSDAAIAMRKPDLIESLGPFSIDELEEHIGDIPENAIRLMFNEGHIFRPFLEALQRGA